jgi:hypothetical protein
MKKNEGRKSRDTVPLNGQYRREKPREQLPAMGIFCLFYVTCLTGKRRRERRG